MKKEYIASILKNKSTSTISAAVISIVGLTAATLVMLFGGSDKLALSLALFAFITPIILALIKIDEVHTLTNSTLTKLLAEVDELKKALVVAKEETVEAKKNIPV